MNEQHVLQTATELGIQVLQAAGVAKLLDDGATIPFIARYRKEATGSLDEVAIASVRDRLRQLEELEARKAVILKSLEQQGKLTDELQEKVLSAPALAVLEDIYLPYRPKRKTKGSIAREKGLEPLAHLIFAQEGADPMEAAAEYVDPEKGVESAEDALSGARDIVAEIANEDETARARLRQLFFEKGVFFSKVASGKEEGGIKYKDYFEWQEPSAQAPSHRILAMRRGEKEEFLNLNLAPPESDALSILEKLFVKSRSPDGEQVKMAVHDAYKRLLSRSMETELRLATKERADADAIKIFAENLRHLLMAPPLGSKRVLGVDPGFRTGCKIVCLDRQGKLLHHDVAYLHMSEGKERVAAEMIRDLCRKFQIEAVAVGNGTAGRETQAFIQALKIENTPVFLVNEAGASIYSASETARREFPDLDLTVRGSASIGRRLMDPLSELVKIDPKSIGVGQYQHDVDQTKLKDTLDDVVVSCVNAVGVDVNRASVELLTYVSGLGPALAANIVKYRNENGAFEDRKELKKTPRLGPKSFEQCAGFLRIRDGKNPLDAGAVHPESYPVVEAMARDLNCTVEDLIENASLREKIDIQKYVTDTIGIPTLADILQELAKPGRDPRDAIDEFEFAGGIQEIGDLRTGMKLPGIVTNVTAFGAFVDVGVHQDGLVHVSELADRFVKNPADVVKVHQKVEVTVLEVDIDRKRIALSMKKNPIFGERTAPAESSPKPSSSRGPKNRKKAQEGPKKQTPAPFNNPFADLFGKK